MVAIGAEPKNLSIPGADSKKVIMPIAVYGHEEELGKNIVVVGGGEIGVELRQVGGEVVVRGWDTGSGMTPEVQSHIFEKYYQGAAEDKKHGLGLGLSIVHRIIELTEGRIEVDSQPEQGSSFTVYLPLNQKGA